MRFQKLPKKNPSVQEGRPRNFGVFEPSKAVRIGHFLSIFAPLTVNQPLIREKKYPFFSLFFTFLAPRHFFDFLTFFHFFSKPQNFTNSGHFLGGNFFGSRGNFLGGHRGSSKSLARRHGVSSWVVKSSRGLSRGIAIFYQTL